MASKDLVFVLRGYRRQIVLSFFFSFFLCRSFFIATNGLERFEQLYVQALYERQQERCYVIWRHESPLGTRVTHRRSSIGPRSKGHDEIVRADNEGSRTEKHQANVIVLDLVPWSSDAISKV